MRARLSRGVQRVRRELRDLVGLVLLPGLAILLPWRLCFLCFRGLSWLPFLYRSRCEASLAVAQEMGYVERPGQWLRRYRLLTLTDHADLYLARFRSDRWRLRHLRRCGEWPAAASPFLGCTFHWGAGMWALYDVARSGVVAHALVGTLDRQHFRGQTVLGRYSMARVAQVGEALGTAPVDVGRDLRRVLSAIKQGKAILAAVDVPPDEVVSSLALRFLGRQVRVPRGIFRLAASQRLPVVFYLTGLDFRSGERTLHVTPPLVSEDPDELVRGAYKVLEEWIGGSPESWHFWFLFRRFEADGTEGGTV